MPQRRKHNDRATVRHARAGMHAKAQIGGEMQRRHSQKNCQKRRRRPPPQAHDRDRQRNVEHRKQCPLAARGNCEHPLGKDRIKGAMGHPERDQQQSDEGYVALGREVKAQPYAEHECAREHREQASLTHEQRAHG